MAAEFSWRPFGMKKLLLIALSTFAISAQAWDEWLAHQTRLINEKHLELFDPETRKYLQEQMELFFRNSNFDQASGYKEE